ncbi:MAG: hypothetical protein SGILL_008643, partial [Bacillariaceae sp.]
MRILPLLALPFLAVQGFVLPTQQQHQLSPRTIGYSTTGAKGRARLFSSVEKDKQQHQQQPSDDADMNASSTTTKKSGFRSKVRGVYYLPRTAYRVYTSYFSALWKATSTSARNKIANDKVRTAVRQVQLILQNTGEYDESMNEETGVLEDPETREAKEKLLKACDSMLATLGTADIPQEDSAQESTADSSSSSSTEVAVTTNTSSTEVAAAPKKKHRSIVFGAIMGAAVACWVFSGNYIFTGLFCLMTILGQLEYYRMVMNTGVFPARRISVFGATSMFLT